jgi:hypothetical protein
MWARPALRQIRTAAGGSQVGAYAIHREVIFVRMLPVHAELAAMLAYGA